MNLSIELYNIKTFPYRPLGFGSMSKKGDCWDNAVPESFFGRLKQERVMWRNYQTRFEAQQDILNYITMHYIA
jgi:transposase InsO family protein